MSGQEERKVAMVTGASRGIGKWIAIELADAGYDVAITARTVHEGESREHSSTIKKSDTSPLPGSLDGTVAEIEKIGGRAMAVAADLLEPATLGAATQKVIDSWGRIDVMVHNGRYIGPGHMDLFLDTPIDILRKHLEANCLGPLAMNRIAVPQMLKQGGGTLIHITSGAAYGTPTKPAGKGGHGMGYGLSKAAFHRTASFFNTELGDQGIRAFNVQPGLVATERIAQDMKEFGIGSDGAPPQVVGRVVRWLCDDPKSNDWLGTTIEAQYFCHKQGLLPGWKGPYVPKELSVQFDLSGYELKMMMEELMEKAEQA